MKNSALASPAVVASAVAIAHTGCASGAPAVDQPGVSLAENPEGLLRSWQSAFTKVVVSGHAFRVDAIAANPAQSFTEERWEAITAAAGATALTNDTLAFDILSTPEAISDSEANLLFEANGPCVETAGKDSDEVTALETPTEN